MSSTPAYPLPAQRGAPDEYRPPGLPAPADWLDARDVPGLAPLGEEWQRRVAIFEAALRREPELAEEFATEDAAYAEALRAAYAEGDDADAIDPPTSPDDRALSVRDARSHVEAAHASLVAYVGEAKQTIREHLTEWSSELAEVVAEHDADAREAERERVEAEQRARKAKARAGYTRRVADWLYKAGTSDSYTNRPPSNKRRVKGVGRVAAPSAAAPSMQELINRNSPAPFQRPDVAVSANAGHEELVQAAQENARRSREFVQRMEAEDQAERAQRDRRHRSFIAEQDAQQAEQTARIAAEQARAARAAINPDEYTEDTYR